MFYELYLLKPLTPDSFSYFEWDTSLTLKGWSGFYNFGTDGLYAEIKGDIYGWALGLAIRDVAGVSGEVKRIENLQDFRVQIFKDYMGLFGGILSEDFVRGRVRGEGLGIFYKGDTLKFLRSFSDVKRVNFRLFKGFNGPYVIPSKGVVENSVRVYINGRVLKSGYVLKNGAIYITREFEDGDILTVEYQESTGSQNLFSYGVIRVGGFFIRGSGITPQRFESFKGCIRTSKGDYRFSKDTFYIDVLNGDLMCDFVNVKNGDYKFLGDRFVFVGSGGDYTIKPIEGNNGEYMGEVGFERGGDYLSINFNDRGNMGGRWNYTIGEKIYAFSFGNFGYNPYIPYTATGVNTGNYNINLGIGLNFEGLNGKFLRGFFENDFVYSGDIKLGMDRGFYANLLRTSIWNRYEFGGFIKGLFAGGFMAEDTFGRSYGINGKSEKLVGTIKRYDDGFLAYDIGFIGEGLVLNYGVSKMGRSFILGLIWKFIRLDISSSISFKKEERFIYVGKGWGDYERDSLGMFYPKPFGSYKREMVYFPTYTAIYDIGISVLEYLNASLRTDFKDLKTINLNAWFGRDSVGVKFDLYRDVETGEFRYNRVFNGFANYNWFMEYENLKRVFGKYIEYNSLSFGYKFFGLEVLKSTSWALSPFIRIRKPFSLSLYYRNYYGEKGDEVYIKPEGPVVLLGFYPQKNLYEINISGHLYAYYDKMQKFSWNFGLSVSGEF
ncbi:MAG: hypothetical protein ABIL12_06745 [candidate division WOR-3 bacterium]